jgi:hypothetical protein
LFPSQVASEEALFTTIIPMIPATMTRALILAILDPSTVTTAHGERLTRILALRHGMTIRAGSLFLPAVRSNHGRTAAIEDDSAIAAVAMFARNVATGARLKMIKRSKSTAAPSADQGLPLKGFERLGFSNEAVNNLKEGN